MKKGVLILIIVFLTIVIAGLFWSIGRHINNEVLESFGTLNKNFEEANVATDNLCNLKKRLEQSEDEILRNQAKGIEQSSNKLSIYIEVLKTQMLTEVNMTKDSMNFAVMDKPSKLLFKNDKEIGNEFVSRINTFSTEIVELSKDFSNEDFNNQLQNLFKTGNINTKDWLTYEFDSLPLIASYTKLSALQNDIEVIQ